MKRTLLAAAASLALAVPAGVGFAQDTVVAADAAGNAVVLTTEQQADFDAWPADRRTAYDAWPTNYRSYYWTLTPEQRSGWWALTDEQRGRVYAMTPEQRTAAWASIMAQMNAAPATTTASTSTSVASSTSASADTSVSANTTSSGNMQFVRREIAQPVAGSADAAALASGDLPVCTPNQQDGCINSWEKNKTGTKPLSYWPGKPASEIPGKKPDPQ